VPLNHLLRRWLWRANALLALGVLALGARILFVPIRVETPMPRLDFDWGEVGSRPLEAPVDFEDVVRECGRFWPMSAPPPRPQPRPVSKPTRPALGAYEVAMWIRVPDEPDGVLLSCKDPAHPTPYLPRVGQPDRGVAIEAIRVEGRVAWITVTREEERFTYRFALDHPPDPGLVRIGPAAEPAGGAAQTLPGRLRGSASDAPVALADLKCVPFHGEDGRVVGLRVTGVRPGGRFDRVGLRRNDVVVGCAGTRVERFGDLARLLARSSHVDLTVRRRGEGGVAEVDLGGG